MIKIILREYLNELKQSEMGKPIFERRHVPVIREFVEAARTTESNFYKFLRNGQENINRGFLDASVKLLKTQGFDVRVENVIEFKDIL
ncbi:MAG: hypothetical protein ACYS8Y_11970 [Planctomycetota bacterium]|jgi:hypothetical protein